MKKMEKLLVRFRGSANPVSEEERQWRVANLKGVLKVGWELTNRRGVEYVITRIDDDGVWGTRSLTKE